MDFEIRLELLVPALLGLAGVTIGLWQYVQARRRQLLVDLQGSKSAVAAVAMRIWSGRFPKGRWSRRHRRELFEALCLAAVFERSGRSRSLIYGALTHAGKDERFREEIREIVDRTTVIVSRSWAYTDLQSARRRLMMLRAALHLDVDVRLRLDAFELHVSRAEDTWPPDSRLDHRAFARANLTKAVEFLGSLVLVSPPERVAAVIALDYHRGARQTSAGSKTALPTTHLGAEVVRAKYGDPGDGSKRDPGDEIKLATARLANQLAAFIDRHPDYGGAKSVAAVPGRRHDFSEKLGAAVAEKTKKPLVRLKQVPAGSLDESPRFTVGDASGVTDSIIVVDDVYRTGRTLAAAAAALIQAGAKDVLGLTATCTISATTLPCAQDCDGHDQAVDTPQ
jgi:hypothetical protein